MLLFIAVRSVTSVASEISASARAHTPAVSGAPTGAHTSDLSRC